MRFRDQREQAVQALKDAGYDENRARRAVRHQDCWPRPVARAFDNRGDHQNGNGSVFSKGPRKRLRGTIPPHPIKVINQARRIQRNCNHMGEPYEDNGLHYCPNCHLAVEVLA